MNKVTLVSLLAVLLVSATNGFAQSNILSKINPAEAEASIAKGVEASVARETSYLTSLAPKVSGVYIPTGTTQAALESRVLLAAQRVKLPLSLSQAQKIAGNPEMLRKFQHEIQSPLFDKKVLTTNSEEGAKILHDNQAKIMEIRTNGEYENLWAEMPKDKMFQRPSELAHYIYFFYVKHGLSKDLPRVRMLSLQQEGALEEGIICELPVNGLKAMFRNRPVDITAEQFVVFGNEQEQLLIPRRMLEEGYAFEVLK